MGHHVAGNGGRHFNVVRRTGRDFFRPVDDLFRQTTAVQGGDLALQLLTAGADRIPFRQEEGHTERPTTRNDGDLVYRIVFRNQAANDGVARFVIRGRLFLRFGHHHGATFRTHHDLVFGFFELHHRHHALVAAGGEQRRFVDQVGQVGTGEARRTTRNDGGVDVGSQRHAAHVHLQDLLTATHIRQPDHDLTVETARAQQRRVKHVWTVGRRDDDDALVAFETVHLNQHLVQGLLTLIVTATQAGATLATDGVDFIDEDDARRGFLRLFEHVAHAGCTHADEHFDEVGTGNGEERYLRFAGDRFRQQRFTGPRRANHQHAFRDLAAQLLETARFAQVFHQFAHLFFRFVTTGDIGESGLDLVFRQHAGLALAEGHRALAAAALHLPHKEDPDPDQQQHREPRDKDRSQQARLFRRLADNFHILR